MHKVLLVDDERLNRLVAVRTLERQGVFVVTADNGAEAVAAAARDQFDAIIMDCQMPTMDGFQATASIREHEANSETSPHTPIIGLSARAMDGDREAALAAGMDDYLTKPLRAEELRVALRRWLPGTATDELVEMRAEVGGVGASAVDEAGSTAP
jgi:two-component system sensor histidine kinase/response regulator